jgi:hypothetical protein
VLFASVSGFSFMKRREHPRCGNASQTATISHTGNKASPC